MNEIWIGDLITLDGRQFTVHGFDPMSVPEQTVELVDRATGETVRVPLARLNTASVPRARPRSSRWPQRAWLRRKR